MRRTLPWLIGLLAFASPSVAQIDTPSGVVLSPFPILQTPANYASFGDRVNGAWALFMSTQPTSGVYGQHINHDGTFANGFTATPRALVPENTQVNSISCAPDRVGGAVLTWFGVSPADPNSPFLALRMKHLDFNGGVLAGFPDTGVVVSSIASAAMVAGDGAGGTYVVWEELKSISNPDIFAQHYDAAGTPLWTPLNSPSGRPVCAIIGLQRLRALHEDGAGGAIVVWADSRASGSPGSTPLYVARLTPGGVAGGPWTTNGVRVTAISSGIRIVGSSTAPDGGLWLAWRDQNGSTQTLGQSITNAAAFAWPALGAILATVSPTHVDFVPTPSGNAFVDWGGTDLRCALISTSGVRLWPETAGRVIYTPAGATQAIRAAPDGQGGQRIAWSYDNAGQSDSYLLNVDASATPVTGQPPGGDPLAMTLVAEDPVAVIPDPVDAPLVVWLSDGQLRVRRIGPLTTGVGNGPSAGTLALAAPAPNPWRGGPLALRFTAPAGDATAELYDMAGRRMATHAIVSRGGPQATEWTPSRSLPPGVYTVRLTTAAGSSTRRVVRIE